MYVHHLSYKNLLRRFWPVLVPHMHTSPPKISPMKFLGYIQSKYPSVKRHTEVHIYKYIEELNESCRLEFCCYWVQHEQPCSFQSPEDFKPTRPQNSFPQDTASWQTKFKKQCHRTVAYWTPCLQFYTSLKCLSDGTCLISSMENNISSTKHIVTYQLLQSTSSGVITLIYSVTSLTQLCPIPWMENNNRAEQLFLSVLNYKRKWSDPYSRMYLCDVLRESVWNQSECRRGYENIR